MLTIKFIDNDDRINWHVNNPILLEGHSICDIEYICAHGHELTHIIDIFNNDGVYTIPVTDKQIMYWCGSIAQTIIANLCS